MMPILSILIPAIDDRLELAMVLYADLLRQIKGNRNGHQIELLMLTDNRRRSVGHKRQALLDIARGRFVAFVDDDDGVFGEYIDDLVCAALENPDVDVITHDVQCSINGGNPALCRQGIGLTNTELTTEGATRQPFHHCGIRRELAQSARFPDLNYGEDVGWLQQLWPKMKTEFHINMPIYHYRFDREVTRTQ